MSSGTVKDVAKRIEHEVGLSQAAALRIAKKLNKLARSVDWATAVEETGPHLKQARMSARRQKSRARTRAVPQAGRKMVKKSR